MHIRRNAMALNHANLYSAAQAGRAAAAQKAVDVRKKLLRNASRIEASPEETLLIGHWLEARENESPSDDEYHANAAD